MPKRSKAAKTRLANLGIYGRKKDAKAKSKTKVDAKTKVSPDGSTHPGGEDGGDSSMNALQLDLPQQSMETSHADPQTDNTLLAGPTPETALVPTDALHEKLVGSPAAVASEGAQG